MISTTGPQNAITGNAQSLNGIAQGVTTPNPSTRAQFDQAVARLNSPVNNVGQNLIASDFDADAILTTLATTVTGVPDVTGFSGSAAVSGANILGLSDSDITVGNDVLASNSGSNLGNITASAIGVGSSTSSTFTGNSAAAVVDLAAIGLFNSFIDINGSANKLIFSGSLTGNSSATGVTVGSATAVGGTPSLTNGQGTTSILNLNARGLSPQNTYYEDPISPFFAEFSGIPAATTGNLTSTPIGSGDISIGQDGSIEATATIDGSSSASSTTGDTNAFASLFSGGALLIDDIIIGGDGNVSGNSDVGATDGNDSNSTPDFIQTTSNTTTGAASAITNILSAGLGTSAVRSGTSSALNPIGPALISIANDGNVTGDASAYAYTNSQSTTGDVVAFTGGLNGSGGSTFSSTFNPGIALTVGIFNLDINGVGNNDVSADTKSAFITEAQTTTGDAIGSSKAITAGIFGFDQSSTGAGPSFDNTTLGIVNGDITGGASSINWISSTSTTGDATGSVDSTTIGIGNTDMTISQHGTISGIAEASNRVQANTITGNAQATSRFNVIGIDNSSIVIGGNGSISASATLVSSVGV